MKILAIETSCDETAIGIVEAKESKSSLVFNVCADAMYSQVDIHKDFGGVVPNLAKRAHGQNLVPLLEKALQEAKLPEKGVIEIKNKEDIKRLLEREGELGNTLLSFAKKYGPPDIDIIAVTYGPGLEPALWVGINFAKALGVLWNKPIVPVNHMEGHIFSVLLKEKEGTFITQKIKYPALALLISGGHTELVLMKEPFNYTIVGSTRDDAVGEAFDKVARILGLPYPGGPEISKLAEKAMGKYLFTLPRPMIHSENLDFSFSGLKTAVLYTVKDKNLSPDMKADIAKEFEEAVTDVLVTKTIKALKKYGVQSVIIGGGVSANKRIRATFTQLSEENRFILYLPSSRLSTDNAIMIAIAGFLRHTLAPESLQKEFPATGNLAL